MTFGNIESNTAFEKQIMRYMKLLGSILIVKICVIVFRSPLASFLSFLMLIINKVSHCKGDDSG